MSHTVTGGPNGRPVSCQCGTCTLCKRREYWRQRYHTKNRLAVLHTQENYWERPSGWEVEVQRIVVPVLLRNCKINMEIIRVDTENTPDGLVIVKICGFKCDVETEPILPDKAEKFVRALQERAGIIKVPHRPGQARPQLGV